MGTELGIIGVFDWLTGIAEVQILHCPSGLHLLVFDPTNPGADGAEADNSRGTV